MIEFSDQLSQDNWYSILTTKDFSDLYH